MIIKFLKSQNFYFGKKNKFLCYILLRKMKKIEPFKKAIIQAASDKNLLSIESP